MKAALGQLGEALLEQAIGAARASAAEQDGPPEKPDETLGPLQILCRQCRNPKEFVRIEAIAEHTDRYRLHLDCGCTVIVLSGAARGLVTIEETPCPT